MSSIGQRPLLSISLSLAHPAMSFNALASCHVSGHSRGGVNAEVSRHVLKEVLVRLCTRSGAGGAGAIHCMLSFLHESFWLEANPKKCTVWWGCQSRSGSSIATSLVVDA